MWRFIPVGIFIFWLVIDTGLFIFSIRHIDYPIWKQLRQQYGWRFGCWNPFSGACWYFVYRKTRK